MGKEEFSFIYRGNKDSDILALLFYLFALLHFAVWLYCNIHWKKNKSQQNQEKLTSSICIWWDVFEH